MNISEETLVQRRIQKDACNLSLNLGCALKEREGIQIVPNEQKIAAEAAIQAKALTGWNKMKWNEMKWNNDLCNPLSTQWLL